MNQVSLINTLQGSRNVITGCARGLGRATLRWFLLNNCGPVLCIDQKFEQNFEHDLDLDEAQTRGKLMLKQHNTFDDCMESSMAEFVEKHGTIDNVINVAGVSLNFILPTTWLRARSHAQHSKDLLNFNTYGTFNVIRLASKYMIDDNLDKSGAQLKRKCIVNASCISTYSPTLGQTFYAGTKAAIDSMTLCIARELAPFNIRCNTINVGLFDTQLIHCHGEKVSRYAARQGICPTRLAKPEEFAHLVQTIVENQMINGACIKLDAGARFNHLFS